MIKVFEYRSTGKKYNGDEHHFFQFVVKQNFFDEKNRSIQWCRFEGFKVIVETLEPSIVEFVKLTLKPVIETKTGYKWELIN
ncbi:MAG: hypothetical protein ACK4K9_10040 [Bacteroidia bacterium]